MACTTEQSEILLSQRPLLESSLTVLVSNDVLKANDACETYCVTLDWYLEISTLLDPILPSHTAQLCQLVMTRLTDFMSEDTSARDRTFRVQLAIELPCRAIYTLAKVRVVKPFCTHLPHQVEHLRFLLPALAFAERNFSVNRSWHVRYVLFIWSSVAIRVPFPLTTIVPDDVITSAIDTARRALTEPSRISDVAAAFLARLLARRDASDFRVSIINSAVADALAPNAPSDIRAASLALLAATFKHAHRDDVIPFIEPVYDLLERLQPDTLVESHRLSKLAHRVALAFLPPRSASWRYSRPTLQLFVNAESKVTSADHVGHVGHVDVADTESSLLSEVDAERLEAIIDLLFNALRHRDTVVRYSAAKGVARISARLPITFAHDVADSLLELFADRDEARADAAAHGGCLAVAELVRRGLILPNDEQFARALDAIREAARFDIRKGASSVGAHVRDAACYAVWAVARAYERQHVTPFGSVITEAMLPVALLDREVNCRRAAAAALQECVGRLSDNVFPEGITLITVADYFSLGDRNAAYLEVAPKVAQLGNGVYFACILEELWKTKLFHWDAIVRVLAAKAISKFILFDTDNVIIKKVIPTLVEMATKRGDVVFRHGAVLGLSELASRIDAEKLGSHGTSIRRIPMTLNESGLFSGRAGDEMRFASCHLIESLAKGASSIYLVDSDGRIDAEKSLKILERILGCGKEKMYAEATSAYEAMCLNVIANDLVWHSKVTKRVLNGVHESPLTELQRGFALAAGACGESELSHEVISTLCNTARSNVDVEVRRNACTSLAKVLFPSVIDKAVDILNTLAQGMQDYATDDRGDIGSWVREASMLSYFALVDTLFSKHDASKVKGLEDTLISGICEVIRECCGRIDRTRTVAGKALKGICFVLSEKRVGFSRTTALCKRLNSIFEFSHGVVFEGDQASDSTEVDFGKGVLVFPAMQKVLQVPDVRSAAMRGFVASGGGTRSQFKAPCAALVDFFHSIDDNDKKGHEFESGIVQVVKERDQRLMIPALNVISALVRLGALTGIKEEVLLSAARTIHVSWRGRTQDVKLLMAAMAALDELVCLSIDKDGQFVLAEGSLGSACLEAMMVVLGGGLPRLRRLAAESIYIALNLCDVDGYEGGCDEKIMTVVDVLLDTAWEAVKVGDARKKRNEICHLLGVRAPVAIAKK